MIQTDATTVIPSLVHLRPEQRSAECAERSIAGADDLSECHRFSETAHFRVFEVEVLDKINSGLSKRRGPLSRHTAR